MANDDGLLGLVSGKKLTSVYKLRKPGYDCQTVKFGKEQHLLDDGWSIAKKNKKSYRLAKQKPQDRHFEDRVWCLFYKMGFMEMNEDRNFRIQYQKEGPGKQIDVFAKDNETIVIVECKSRASPKPSNLQKDLSEACTLREEIRKRLYREFPVKPKLVWVFATDNVMWSKADLERADSYRIPAFRETDIEYYEKLSQVIGSAAKYQLLADFFQKSEIPGLKFEVPAMKGRIGDFDFYTFAIEPAKLLKIGYVCHRFHGNDDRTLLTYQRMLSQRRLKEIRQFINEGGIFPNSILINVESGKKPMRFDKITQKGNDINETQATLGILHLPPRYKSCYIIDGQHRLYGFVDTEFDEKVTVPVIAFENLDAKVQADMFVDINSKQKKVKRNLLEDLVAETKWSSDKADERLAALISKTFSVLGKRPDSPLYGRISSGESTKDKRNALTIASLTEPLGKTNLVGSVKSGSSEITPGPLYATDMESSLERSTSILSGYFGGFMVALPDHWALGGLPGGYLCTNGGITALLLVLKAIVDQVDKEALEAQTLRPGEMKADELLDKVNRYAEPVIAFFKTASPEVVTGFRKRVGSSGHIECSYAMMELIHLSFESFQNQGLMKYIENKKSRSNEKAKIIVPSIQLMIADKVISSLKDHFGPAENEWWLNGVPMGARKDAATIQQDSTDELLPIEKCLMLIDYKKIILNNWQLLGPYFGRGQGGKDKQMSWMNDLNRIRKKVMHPERGIVTIEELAFLNEIEDWLHDKAQNS